MKKSRKSRSAKLRLREQDVSVTIRTTYRFAGIVGDSPHFEFVSSAYQKLTARWRSWASEGLSNWTAMPPIQQSTALDEIVRIDALWQLWLSHDCREFWGTLSKDKKLFFIQYCVEESIWWRNFMAQEGEWNWVIWPWQKQYAFLRTAGGKAMNMQLEHPIDVQLIDVDTDDMDASTESMNMQIQLEHSSLRLTDPKRSLLVTQMEDYAKEWDEEWAKIYDSPMIIPPIYLNCDIPLI